MFVLMQKPLQHLTLFSVLHTSKQGRWADKCSCLVTGGILEERSIHLQLHESEIHQESENCKYGGNKLESVFIFCKFWHLQGSHCATVRSDRFLCWLLKPVGPNFVLFSPQKIQKPWYHDNNNFTKYHQKQPKLWLYVCVCVCVFVCVFMYVYNNNNNVHLSCAHQRPERSHDTY